MLRFAFKPRHPITQVAFTADGREVVTAQPFTGVAVRDRLSGTARFTFPMTRIPDILGIAVRADVDWIGVRSSAGIHIVGPSWESGGGRITSATGYEFGTTAEADPLLGWSASSPPVVWTHRLYTAGSHPQLWSRSIDTTVRTTGGIRAISPDARFALCFRPQVRPMLASVFTGLVMAELTSPVRLRHTQWNSTFVFSPDGLKLALGDGESLSVFDLAFMPLNAPEEAGKRKVVHPLFTLERPDPSRLGTHADKQAEHWLPPVAFDHAGRTMFTLGLRNRVQRIDLATGGVMGEWGWRCEPIRSLAVAPDDLTAAAGCQRGELVLWDLE